MVRKIPTLLFSCLCAFALVATLHAQGQSTPAEEHGYHIISPTLCFTLTIPGDWEPARDEGSYLSRDGKQFVGVLRFSAKSLQREAGNTLVEKEASAVQRAYEKDLRKKLLDVKLVPFESAIQGTWKWSATLPEVKDRDTFHLPKRYFIDFGPEGLVALNIQGTPDDDAFARRIIATVRHSKERPCQLPHSVNELLDAAGVRPDGSAKPLEPLVTYNSALYGWSVSYPKSWKVDDFLPEFVQIRPADKSGLCGIHTMGVESKYKTTEEFADFMLSGREEYFGSAKSLSRQPAKLPSGQSGIESLADIQAKGRSHQLFVVANGAGYVVDCEAEIPNWGKLAPSFEQVIRSFSVPNLTGLTDADTAPPRRVDHPQHVWSIAYPGGWKLDASDPDNVSIERPDSFAYAGCGIHRRPRGQASSLDEFADASLRRSSEGMQKDGIQVRITSRKNIILPNDVTGIEVMREMKVTKEVSGDGRSRSIFVLADGMGYILDCQTDARLWDILAPVFEQMINSFALEKKP